MFDNGQIVFLWMWFMLELNAFTFKSLLIFCVELWKKYLLRWILWGLLNRCYFLPVHTKYGLCSVRLSVTGDDGVQRDHQFKDRARDSSADSLALEWWHCWEVGLGLVQNPSTVEVFELSFLLPTLLPNLSVTEKAFFKEKLSCKKLQRKQKWSAVLNRGFHFLCSSVQHRACKAALGLQLALQQFTPVFNMQRAVIHP